MNLFDVYPLSAVTPVKAEGVWVYDSEQKKYLDLYGGHAVISIGHTHPVYVNALTKQLQTIGFYSNAVQNPLQVRLAERLGKISGYPDYQLFLSNSGAEANENAVKVASFFSGRKKVLAFTSAFHGRTSGAVALTDNKNIVAPFNATENAVIIPWNDEELLKTHLETKEYAAVIIEIIQGVGGIKMPDKMWLKALERICKTTETLLITDEIQCGCGRTGKYFAHQHFGITPDIITMAKGIGNGFPIGATIIHPKVKPQYGMLGTTFGGNYLAATAAMAVIEVMEQEKLTQNAENVGNYLLEELFKKCKTETTIKEIRGMGLMVGIEFNFPIAELQKTLLIKYNIFTGSSGKNTLRLLPPLSIQKSEIDIFLTALDEALKGY